MDIGRRRAVARSTSWKFGVRTEEILHDIFDELRFLEKCELPAGREKGESPQNPCLSSSVIADRHPAGIRLSFMTECLADVYFCFWGSCILAFGSGIWLASAVGRVVQSAWHHIQFVYFVCCKMTLVGP
jgi:hypothetical protein